MATCASSIGCSDPETPFGDPGGVLRRPLPNESPAATGSAGPFAAPYSATENPPPPTTTYAQGHAGKAAPGVPLAGSVDDAVDCLSCHGESKAGSTVKWSFGGRVVVAAAGAANVDVVVVNPDGKALGPVKSDADGFFWAPIALGAVADGASTLLRNAKGENRMGQLLKPEDASCDNANCHVSDKQGKIFATP